MDQKLYFTIPEAAERIGVSTQTLRDWDRDRIMTPRNWIGTQRHYSLAQVENCRLNFDPSLAITTLSAENLCQLLRMPGTFCKTQIRLADGLKDQYEALCIALMRVSNHLWVKTMDFAKYLDCPPNSGVDPNKAPRFVIASADLMDILVASSTGLKQAETSSTVQIGMLNHAWMLYKTVLMPPGRMLVGRTIDGTLDVTPLSLGRVEVEMVV